MQDQLDELVVREPALYREVAQRRRLYGERRGERPVAAAGGAVAGSAVRRVQPFPLALLTTPRAQRGDVGRHRPTVFRRQRFLELGHGGAGDPDRDLAVDVHG